MDLTREFPGYESVEDVQEKFFREQLPNKMNGRYLYRKRGLQAKLDTAVLFQCGGKIIAIATLTGAKRFEQPTEEGYKGWLIFDPESIEVFDPVGPDVVRKIWPAFKRFSQVQQKLDPQRYPSFTRQLAGIEGPQTPQAAQDADNYNTRLEQRAARARKDPQARSRRLALAPKKPRLFTATITLFDRNPDVIEAVLERAAGRCEACRTEAPFRRARDGSPYLEVHHKVRLAEYGDDTEENAIAVCPNCHRKAHYG